MHLGKDTVIKVLGYYKNIDNEMRFNNRIIKDLDDEYNSIGSLAIDNIRYDNNKISQTTEEAALNINDTVREILSITEKQNKRLGKLKVEIFNEISSLSYVEKVIIVDFYINNKKWEQISEQLSYSIRQCKNIRGKAIKKLEERFTRNNSISTHDFPI